MRTKGLLTIAVATIALVVFRAAPREIAAQGGTALQGVVTSQEEGKMEGVVVSARRDGGISTVSVVSDKSGKYTFPRVNLEPGSYKVTIRAAGFDLTDPGAVTVAAGKTTTTDLKLSKTKDLAAQLSSLEWMNSMGGTPEQKDKMVHQLLSCNYCHTYQRIAKTKYTQEQFMGVIDRMVKYYADGSAVSNDNKRGRAARIQEPGRVAFLEKSPNFGASPGYPRTEVAEFWAMNNLSGGKTTWAYDLKPFPRPTGAATRIVITEYDMPTAGTASHDSALDAKGILWFTDESSMLLGRFDTKAGTFKEYQMPAIPQGIIPGTRDVVAGKDGKIWLPVRNQKGDSQLVMFDPMTEKPTFIDGVSAQFIAEGPDGKIWAGWRRVDPVTLKADPGNFNPQATAVIPKGAASYAGNSEVDSKGNPWMATQIGPGGAMGFDIAANKAIWWPVEGLAGRRGAIDSQDRLWYGEYRADKVAMIDTRTGRFQRWDLPKYAGPYTSSKPDSKGRVYAPSNMAERLFRVDPKTNTIIAYQWPTEFDTKKINWDPAAKGTVMWFANMRTARISRVEILD